ncbi:hypothetical protein CUT44_03975 [Streptomyces carminius]|uniref:Uncharacterized protein n=1 Tax=Streptomyces carminius TaxID=2665496 RepID=A0A2M8M628_9ACTN|nr:hypothetical protein [Streptomyces carminius]PJE99665.1 hypothetical protein CUT44_03975 [Streptomyces carminius]
MTPLTFGDLDAALRALRLLAVEYPHLPAPCVTISTVYPDRLELALHDDLAAFEEWREVLGIAPGAVGYGEQRDGRTRVLTASVDYAGARVRLVGYGTVATVGEAA